MTVATIRHAHAPQQHTDPEPQRRAAIAASFALGSDTIGWTELETIDQVAAVHERKGWDTYWPARNADGSPHISTVASGKRRPSASNAVTISWRTDVWEFVKGKSRQIHGGKANVSPSRFITEVWLRNIATGVVVRFVQSHWVSGVQPIFKEPAKYRRESLEASIDLMEDVLMEGLTPTIVSLDANTTRLPKLMENAPANWERTGGTHGPRQIDWVGHIDVTPVQFTLKSTARRVLNFLDHKATVASFTLTTPDDHTDPEVPVSDGLCPFAIKRLIAPGANDPAIKPRVAILHVDAGNAESLHDFFATRSGGIESHFHVKKNGEIEQYRSIYRQADANHLANDFAVSIETQGLGAGEWTPNQLTSIKRLLTWLNTEAGIPLRKCPAWDSSGVGFHVQFGAPGKWTPVSKSCPGPERISQFNRILVPWMANGGTITPPAKPVAPASKTPRGDKGYEQLVAARRTYGEIVKDPKALAAHRVRARAIHTTIKAALRLAAALSDKH